MSITMDVRLLIAEVRKRPGLWNFQHEDYKSRQCVPKLWDEVAENVGVDVLQCKRKWKNLRDAYRAEVKRSKHRIKKDKLMGVYEQKSNYNSKWIYFPYLSFISESKQNNSNSIENENTNSDSNDNTHSENYNESVYHDNFVDIKMEPDHDADDNLHLVGDDDDTASDMLFEEFQNIATPPVPKRYSTKLLMNNALKQNFTPQHTNDHSSSSKNHSCECFMRSNHQAHFLKDLGREEKKLMKSTRQDIKRSNVLDHIGDSDYNFLVSFLPQMKKLSELQNLRFRAKMCDTLLNILTPDITEDGRSSSVEQQYLTNNAPNDNQPKTTVHSTSSNNLLQKL